MTVEHSNITDPYIHLPKGFAAASPKQYLRKNAGGTDVEWVTYSPEYGCIYLTSSGATTSITTGFQTVNNATLGGTLVWAEQDSSDNVTANTTDGYFEVEDAGTYQIVVAMSVAGAIAAANVFQFTIGVDSDPYGAIAEKSAKMTVYRTVSTTDVGSATMTCMPILSAGDRVYLMVKRVSGSNQLVFTHTNFTINKVSR